MVTEESLKKFVKKKWGDRWIEYYGPWPMGTAGVYEIWTRSKGTLGYVAFRKGEISSNTILLEDENGSKRYFSYFSELAQELNRRLAASQREAEALKLKKISLYVASLVFVLAVGTMIFLALTQGGQGQSLVVLTAIAGLVSSGAVLFFGLWKQP